jgi:hypothetical protein
VQAALLRAAKDHEFAYINCPDHVGRRLVDRLLTGLDRLNDGEGEAMIEFLIAIACRRLLLPTEQEHQVCVAAREHRDQAVLSFLAAFILGRNDSQTR